MAAVSTGLVALSLRLAAARLLSGQDVTPPAFWLSLHSGDPGGAGAEEHSGGSYARVLAAFTAVNEAGVIRLKNAVEEEFPNATTAQGEVEFVGAFDTATGGNFLCSWAATSPASVLPGYRWTIPAGDLVIELTDE